MFMLSIDIIRDAPIAIFLADSDFFRNVTCRYRFLPIPLFFLRTIIDSICKQKSMQISRENDLHKINYKKLQFPQSGLIYRFSLT